MEMPVFRCVECGAIVEDREFDEPEQVPVTPHAVVTLPVRGGTNRPCGHRAGAQMVPE